ncbi:putative uncharacterized protein ASB16-AS1 [Oenanthe melanoleuca]|uniref:putative uncharacterized protein ASB16-AS1 n=1 Tax=Oenanthe melanoleuca TaxID=2939378 RepID=UPI0024C17869|nr:putative uncharacterized protein ASB16-AS1 [Oenanthe melanoleuca]
MSQGDSPALPWGAVVARGAHVRAQGPQGGRAERQGSPGAAVPGAPGPEPRAPVPEPSSPSPIPGPRAPKGGAPGPRSAARSRVCRSRGLRRRLPPARQLGVAAGQIGAVFPRGMEIWGVLEVVPAEARRRSRRCGGRWVLGRGRRGVRRRAGGGRRSAPAEGASAAGPAAKLLPLALRLRQRALIPPACENKCGKASRCSVDEKDKRKR